MKVAEVYRRRVTLDLSDNEFDELKRILRMAAVHVGKYDLPAEKGMIRRWMIDLRVTDKDKSE